MQNFYEILGISRNASNKQIKDAFIAKMKIYHPDKHHSDNATDSEEICAQIGEAYSTLKDAKLRRNYDLNLPPEKITEKSSFNSNYNQNFDFNFQNQQKKPQQSTNNGKIKKKPINSQEYRERKKSKLSGKDKRDKLALDIALIFFIVILLIMISLIYIN